MADKSFAEVEASRWRLQEYYSQMRAQMDRAEELYHLEYGSEAANTPEGMSTHVPSTAASVVDAAASQLRTDSARVTVLPNGTADTANKKAMKQERLAAGLLSRLHDNYDVSIPQQAFFDANLLGAAAIKVLYDEDSLPIEPDQKAFDSESEFKEAVKDWKSELEMTFPFYCAPIDPRQVFIPAGAHFPYPFAIEAQQRRAVEIKASHPHWLDENPDNPGRLVQWVEYWDKETWQVFVDGQEVRRDSEGEVLRNNPIGVVPYVFSFSGIGARRVGSNPADAAIGMLTKVESELRAEVRLKTALDVLWQMFVYPRMLTTADPETVASQMDMRAGGVVQWRGESHEKPDFLTPPQPNQVMYAMLPEIQGSIQRGTFSETLTGERPRGTDTGYLQSILVGQARLRFGPLKKSVETMLQRTLLLMIQQLRFRRQTVTVFGYDDKTAEGPRRVKPSDLTGHVELRVEFTPGKPMDDRNSVIAMLNVVQGGFLSPRTYIKEILGLDPDEEQTHILAWSVLRQAVANGFLAAELLENVGLQNQVQQGEEALAGAQKTVRKTLQRPGAREGTPALQNLGGLGTPGQVVV